MGKRKGQAPVGGGSGWRRPRPDPRELGKCFLCDWALKVGEYSIANVRTAESPWRQVMVCDGCARMVAETVGRRVEKDGEYFTVRVTK
jgi:uncharacterized protein YlaI